MITVRRAKSSDAPSIGAVHVAAWRSAYPGILPTEYLARLSPIRQAAHYERAILSGAPVFVAIASGQDAPDVGQRLVGFTTAGPARGGPARGEPARGGPARGDRLAEGEVETLYVLDDFRDRGIGRRLLRAAAADLAHSGCRSAFLWVLRDNPSRWFYQRLGGKAVMESQVRVAGTMVPQTAFTWDPIEKLLSTSPAR